MQLQTYMAAPKTLQALLHQISFSKKDELYLLGDYIDRGPDSKGVIDYIWELQDLGYKIHCLRGNHEQMMLEALYDEENLRFWKHHGGKATLKSFNTKDIFNIPKAYFQWMEGTSFLL